MRHLDLFAGIGGFSLAARWAGWETVAHCEINPYCQQVLHKHFPNATLHANIKDLDGTQYRGAVDIITGGFPCQPYSSAGKRLGKDDERHLWPEMLRVIQEVAPRWVVGENVRGLVNWNDGVVFEEVQTDLEYAGYEVQAFLLPAAGVGAPHQRQRIWFVAYSHSISGEGQFSSFLQNEVEIITSPTESHGSPTDTNGNDAGRCGHGQTGCAPDESEGAKKQRKRVRPIIKRVGKKGNAADPNIIGPQRGSEKEKGEKSAIGNHWSKFPTQPGICRGNDGVPNRVDRIKALGNAIVPQVALQIFKAINQYNSL